MPPLPRGHCPACGVDVALRKGGLVREHRPFLRTWAEGSVCPGSGSRATASTEREFVCESGHRTTVEVVTFTFRPAPFPATVVCRVPVGARTECGSIARPTGDMHPSARGA